MVTFNKVVSDLCMVCGVEHDATRRVTERRGIELIRECTEKVKVLTMGTAALATVLTEHLDVESKDMLESVPAAELEGSTVVSETPVELTTEEQPEVPKDEDTLADEPAPAIKVPKLGK